MSYAEPGSATSVVEVTNISKHGFWLLLREREHFLAFADFPWFETAPVGKILNLQLVSENHLYWPELDVDLEVDSILNPQQYPLVSKVSEAVADYAPGVKEWDEEKIDDCALAVLSLTLHDGNRVWKGIDFEVMDRLFQKGYILDPANKNKSVAFTADGLAKATKLCDRLFTKN